MQWWNNISLRTKITGVTVLMLAVGLIVSGIGTMALLKPYMIEQLDDQLRAVSQSKDLRVYFDQGTVPESGGGSPLSASPRESEFFIALYDDRGVLQDHNWRSRPSVDYPQLPATWDLMQTQELANEGDIFWLSSESGQYRFRAMSIVVTIDRIGHLGTAVVAIPTAEIEDVLAAYSTIFCGFGLGVILIGGLLTRMIVTSTFRPLREVERTAEAIANGDFSKRLEGSTPRTEVGNLTRSLNTMLARIDTAISDRNKSIDQMRRFVGDASHELRTPLVSVRGYAELYRMGALKTPDEVSQAVERIEKEAIRMGGLVEDLLQLARLDETKPLEFDTVDVLPLACDAAMDAMASSPGRDVRVFLANDTSPPVSFGSDETRRQFIDPAVVRSDSYERFDSRATIRADENKIRQVITNLVGNALRFTSTECPIEIGVSVDETHRRISIDIIDHGEGIAPEIRDKIFQRFWRADTSRTRETGGSGLGLAIVSSIVAAHHGTVRVDETPGGGATFRVTLPLYRDQ